jgi:hypothetical protein
LGASGTKFPTAILVKRRGKLFALDETLELTSETVNTFVTDGLQGKAKTYRKSEGVPAFVLVGKTFEKYVFDETKDILVKFYAHFGEYLNEGSATVYLNINSSTEILNSSDSKGAYDLLADSFSDDHNVLVAKIDIRKNGYPDNFDFEISDRTLVFFPAKNKTYPGKFLTKKNLTTRPHYFIIGKNTNPFLLQSNTKASTPSSPGENLFSRIRRN